MKNKAFYTVCVVLLLLSLALVSAMTDDDHKQAAPTPSSEPGIRIIP